MNLFVQGFSLLLADHVYPEVLILEMGADHPGDIEYLTRMAPLNIGVLTYVDFAHTEFFKDVHGVAQEKRHIISHLQEDGLAIVNFDNEMSREQVHHTSADVLGYGQHENSLIRMEQGSILRDKDGVRYKVNFHGSQFPVSLNGIYGDNMVYGSLAALAVAAALDINMLDAVEALKGLKPVVGRLNMLEGIRNTHILDDTYNASPAASKASIDVLADMEAHRRIVVHGEMLELGDAAEGLHYEVGQYCMLKQVDAVFAYGLLGEELARGVRETGLEGQVALHFSSHEELITALGEFVQEGDIILVKGSQGSRMEVVSKALLAEPDLADTVLVRQTPYWLARE
jgi:UDP-N-acetylmuramoyl-tripeptide--D-alanyl-D-alanine ligase